MSPTNREMEQALAIAEASRFTRLFDYRPYAKQREFHHNGTRFRERALFAGNQLGKSYSGAAEMAMHLTGLYPEWWEGLRFDHPILAWAAGIGFDHTRGNVQRLLFGQNLGEDLGTGMIPGDCIQHFSMSRGMSELIDTAQIRHVSGAVSTLALKSYEQGRRKWQGAPVHYIWLDEEAPQDIYSEAQARTTATGGSISSTFTPLLGMTDVVEFFFPAPAAPHRAITMMAIEDAEHIPRDRIEAEIAKYPEHEREARTKGIPILGSGRVYPIAESAIIIPDHPIPPYWPRIAGMDFGWDHPTAVAWHAWDRDEDKLVLYAEHRMSEELPVVHTAAIKARGEWIPMSWPHDGMKHEPGSGVPLAMQYKRLGVNMLPEHATFPGKAWTVPYKSRPEAGVFEVLTMMKEGRFKVFASCAMWLEEFRTYHRKDGKIVDRKDDLQRCTHYAAMMRRFARTEPNKERRRQGPAGSYDPLSALQ